MRRNMINRVAPIGACALIVLGLAAVGCDSAPLTAPTNSLVTLTTSTAVLPAGGSAQLSAFVSEPSGTPVQNGTVVRFTTNLGSVDPVEAQTRNGVATATFLAGSVSGEAEVKATSGSSGGGTGTGNSVKIAVGAAAVDSVTLRANPASVPSTGGTVELIASVIGTGGRAMSNIPVSFTATEGQLASIVVLSDASGEARTQLTIPPNVLTTAKTGSVTANAGTKVSNTVSVAIPAGPPAVTVTLASGTPETPTTQGQRFTFTATVTGSVAADPSTQAVRFDWDFGDGTTSQTNGNITAHVFTTELVRRVVTVRVTLGNGTVLTATTEILVGDFP